MFRICELIFTVRIVLIYRHNVRDSDKNIFLDYRIWLNQVFLCGYVRSVMTLTCFCKAVLRSFQEELKL